MLVRKEILNAYRGVIARLPDDDRRAVETYVNILKGQIIHLDAEVRSLTER